MLCVLPAATDTTVLPKSAPAMLTATGTDEVVSESLPNWPLLLLPQDTTFPSEHKAKLWAAPAATAITVLPTSAPPLTRTGTLREVKVPSPSCPKMFPPQATTVPSVQSASECVPPWATCTTVLPARGPV